MSADSWWTVCDFNWSNFQSGKPDQSTGKLNQKFWHDSGAIECIRSRIKRLIFHDFQGGRSELAFLKYFVESALMLKQVVILLSTGSTLPAEEVHSKMANVKRAGEISIALVTGYSELQGRYKRGSEFSLGDLLSLLKFWNFLVQTMKPQQVRATQIALEVIDVLFLWSVHARHRWGLFSVFGYPPRRLLFHD